MAEKNIQFILLSVVTLLILISCSVNARKHHLVLHNDIRRYFPVSTFGYFNGGQLEITVNKLRYYPADLNESIVSNQFGFSLVRTLSNNISPYIDGQYSQQTCTLNQDIDLFNDNLGIVLMKIDVKNNRVALQCNTQLRSLMITLPNEHVMAKRGNNVSISLARNVPVDQQSVPVPKLIPKSAQLNEEKPEPKQEKNDVGSISADLAEEKINEDLKYTNGEPELKSNDLTEEKHKCSISSFQMKRNGKPNDVDFYFTFNFKVFISDLQFEGLYALHFHNCLNYPEKIQELGQYTGIDLDMHIVEKNLDSYLSAGEIPLPQLFFALSVIFFLMGAIWFSSLRNRFQETFMIHYLMGVLVCVKALSLLFHSINYHFIAKEGYQVETWAVLYYVTHFLKGALMFITIVLIGTGWAFIKHILSDKDKKIFMIVIPLQVIANIADIITEESEEGALIHTVWREIFILVDMICCGAILFPVIWSIHHLHEASATDGKAAINLKKLQLFRFFYVMIIIYIYFTRIIVYMVKIMVPFKYEWLDAFFQHAATLVFFVLTGYHFQPTSSNPYHQLLQEDIELDEEVLFIQPSTFCEAKKRNRDLEASGDLQNLLNANANNPHDYD